MCKKYFAIALLPLRRAAALGYVCSNWAKPQIVRCFMRCSRESRADWLEIHPDNVSLKAAVLCCRSGSRGVAQMAYTNLNVTLDLSPKSKMHFISEWGR